VAVIDADVTLPVLEVRGEWRLVRWGGVVGWMLPGDETGPSLLAEEPEDIDVSPAGVAAPAPLEIVQRLLGPRARQQRLGPYTLLTDVPAGEVFDSLARIIPSVEETYRRRFGVEPGPPNGEVMVLFQNASALEVYEKRMTPATMRRGGHAANAPAAFGVGEGTAEDLRGAFIHALVHTLSRRAGLRLPAWLHEGMAEDLACARVTIGDQLLPGTLREGPRSAVEATVARCRRGELGNGFKLIANLEGPESTLGVLFVRYLLDVEKKDHPAARFRSRVAASSRTEVVSAFQLLGMNVFGCSAMSRAAALSDASSQGSRR
jgi:hypothetical protein